MDLKIWNPHIGWFLTIILDPDWGQHAHFKDRKMSIFGRVRSYLAKVAVVLRFSVVKCSRQRVWNEYLGGLLGTT